MGDKQPLTTGRVRSAFQKFRDSDPEFAQKLHAWLTMVWFFAAFPTCIFLASSIPFLVFISVYAVVTGHWAAWQAARTEVAQQQAERRQVIADDRIEELEDAD